MIRVMMLAGVLIMTSTAAAAQEPMPFEWSPQYRAWAGHISDALVVSQVTADTVHSMRQLAKWEAVRCQSLRYAAVLGSTEATKRLVHRTRPDGSDDKSFFSMHTALAFAASGWKVEIGIPIAAGAGYGRMAADKHFLTDVIAGLFTGLGAQQLCDK